MTATDPLDYIKSLIEAQEKMLLNVVREQGEGSKSELDRLSALLGEQMRARSGELDPEERRLSDRYKGLRQQLAGPEEGLVIDVPRVRAVLPERAPAGTEVTIVLANAGTIEGVSFTGAGEVPAPAVTSPGRGQQVKVKVPAGAVDGPVTVRTSRGDAVSAGSFHVGAAESPAAVELVYAVMEVYV